MNHLNTFQPLSTRFPQVYGAATVSEAYLIKDYLCELSNQSDYVKFLNTGTIDKFKSLWGEKKTTYIKSSYIKPIILKKSLRNINATRLYQSTSCKIIIAGMSQSIEAYYDSGNYCAGKSTTIILGNERELQSLIGILNSSLIKFWFKHNFHSLAMTNGYFNIGVNKISQIPIPVINSNNISVLLLIEDKVNKIVQSILDDKSEGISEIEQEIDRLVYQLYCISNDDISLIENEVTS